MKCKPAPFVLASLLTAYPTSSTREGCAALLADPDVAMPEELRAMVNRRVDPENLPDLQSEYIDIFDHGRVSNPLYETEFGRHRALAKGNELCDIAGFYHAFGFQLDLEGGNKDMLDHVSIELEFYALLLMKQVHLGEMKNDEGVSIVEDGRRKFLEAHLGRFAGAIGRRPGVQASDYYSAVYAWVDQLVAGECKALGLNVETVEWIEGESKREEEVCCAVTAGAQVKSAAP